MTIDANQEDFTAADPHTGDTSKLPLLCTYLYLGDEIVGMIQCGQSVNHWGIINPSFGAHDGLGYRRDAINHVEVNVVGKGRFLPLVRPHHVGAPHMCNAHTRLSRGTNQTEDELLERAYLWIKSIVGEGPKFKGDHLVRR